jgi:hypothetical protein
LKKEDGIAMLHDTSAYRESDRESYDYGVNSFFHTDEHVDGSEEEYDQYDDFMPREGDDGHLMNGDAGVDMLDSFDLQLLSPRRQRARPSSGGPASSSRVQDRQDRYQTEAVVSTALAMEEHQVQNMERCISATSLHSDPASQSSHGANVPMYLDQITAPATSHTGFHTLPYSPLPQLPDDDQHGPYDSDHTNGDSFSCYRDSAHNVNNSLTSAATTSSAFTMSASSSPAAACSSLPSVSIHSNMASNPTFDCQSPLNHMMKLSVHDNLCQLTLHDTTVSADPHFSTMDASDMHPHEEDLNEYLNCLLPNGLDNGHDGSGEIHG